MRRTLIMVTVLALTLGGLAAAAGADSNDRPFKAELSGEAFWEPDPDCLAVNPMGLRTMSAAQGNATHLGNVTVSSGHCTPAPDSTIYSGGDMVMSAANGDELHFDYGGVCPLVGDLVVGEVFSCTVVAEVTGGTGRFTGATGSLSGHAYVEFLGIGTPSMPAWWVYEGTIGY